MNPTTIFARRGLHHTAKQFMLLQKYQNNHKIYCNVGSKSIRTTTHRTSISAAAVSTGTALSASSNIMHDSIASSGSEHTSYRSSSSSSGSNRSLGQGLMAIAAAATLFGTVESRTTLSKTTSTITLCDSDPTSSKRKRKKKKKQPALEEEQEETSTIEKPIAPAIVGKENFQDVQDAHDVDSMPVFTMQQLAENNGEDGKPVWMSYGGVVYDVTAFIKNHPGGAEKIMMAAGSHVEPFWYMYRQHFSSDLPMRLMEHMAIGRLSDSDQDIINEQLEELEKIDPYAKEPTRHKSLIMHSDEPCNAELPTHLITQNYLTPPNMFYIRHHHPVPLYTDKQLKEYKLHIDLSECGGPADFSLSLEDLKQMTKTEVTATLQCSGNRRSGYNVYNRTSGTTWGQGAISTAKFGGVLLSEVLKRAGLYDPIKAQREHGIEHVRFYSVDGMSVSIDLQKATNPYGDVIVVYEMNDEPLPREHGSPIRMLVPGYAAIRNPKWVNKIELSKEDADSPFQRGLNYKVLPPSVVDANDVDLSKMPTITEASVYSGITSIERTETVPVGSSTTTPEPGDIVRVRVKGWAWAGGGRNIVRVDVTGDEGITWATATLKEGSDQRFGRAWAWVFWECDASVPIQEDGTVHVASKAVDMAFNSQPEKSDHMWNVRGLCNNSWYRAHVKVI